MESNQCDGSHDQKTSGIGLPTCPTLVFRPCWDGLRPAKVHEKKVGHALQLSSRLLWPGYGNSITYGTSVLMQKILLVSIAQLL